MDADDSTSSSDVADSEHSSELSDSSEYVQGPRVEVAGAAKDETWLLENGAVRALAATLASCATLGAEFSEPLRRFSTPCSRP